jgi:hypothetical protein
MLWRREKSLALLGIKTQLQGHPAHDLVAAMTEPSQLLTDLAVIPRRKKKKKTTKAQEKLNTID